MHPTRGFAPVTEESAERQSLDQRCHTPAVVSLAGHQDEVDRVSQTIE
jgi:hypothetical protein